MYIYEHKNWPHFTWDQEYIASLLTGLRFQQGYLIGSMKSLGFHLYEETILQTLTQDVVKSSEIEGEILDQSLVRSSIARHLGMDIAGLDRKDKLIDGVVEMILNATQQFDQPLTQERLFHWHSSLFLTARFTKIRVGAWRNEPAQVISGAMGKEVIHFEAPLANYVNHEMTIFLQWFNDKSELDLILKAAIAHLWFVTIHPFDDGNGRIGRAIADLLLARSEQSPQRFYSLSAQIQKERKNYYTILEQTQKGNLDITPWIEWFLSCLKRSLENTLMTLQRIVYKAKFWECLTAVSLNKRQQKIINLLLDTHFEGKLTSSKWAKLTKCSQDTAYRDILDLVEKDILFKNPEGGRSTSYSLVTLPHSSFA